MINSSIEELSQLSDVGQITANKIKDYFLDNKNIEVINKLKEYGLNTYSLSSLVEAKENYFKGKRFVLTGTISVSRDEMTKRIPPGFSDAKKFRYSLSFASSVK